MTPSSDFSIHISIFDQGTIWQAFARSKAISNDSIYSLQATSTKSLLIS